MTFSSIKADKLIRVLMRAVRVHEFGGPDVLKFEDNVQIPQVQSNQVLIKVFSAGINPVDTYIRSGTFARKPSLPYTPGNDCAGIVESVGELVTKFQKGDRVFGACQAVSGTCAEYALYQEDYVFNLSEKLNFNHGASLGVPYFTAYRALIQKCNAKPGETVLVHGASGAVGIAAVQMARAYGMTVFGTAGSLDGFNVVKDTGAHKAFSHKESGYTSKIMDATGGKGVDVILEMLSNVNLGKDLNMLAKNGRVAVVGCRGPVEVNPRALMAAESSVVGVHLSHHTPVEWSEAGAAVTAGVEQGWAKPVVAQEYPLEQVAKAHVDIINNTGAKGRLVLSLMSYC